MSGKAFCERRAMYDLSQPNERPGKCRKCNGSGLYCWGPVTNGAPAHSGPCHSCRGTGKQTRRDIRRNETYNRHKIVQPARL
jgi:DnaJ-class molecular chaperone